MNTNYQYAILEEYFSSNGEPRIAPTTPVVNPTPVTPVFPTEPISPTPPILDPVADPSPPTGGGSPITEVGEEPPVTTTGDTSVPVRPSTTINIFGAGTSTTSYADQISFDPRTGQLTTITTDPNAALSPSVGGGGGGGFIPPKSPNGKPVKKKKTLLPLIAVGAGLAVLLFKPFK